MEDIFTELQRAYDSGDLKEVERIQRKILLAGRDESIDENFIASIKGKTLSKSVQRILDNREYTESEYAKIVSSLITHNIIESEKTGRGFDDYPIRELYILLGNIINGEDGAIDECKKFVKERYGRFLQG